MVVIPEELAKAIRRRGCDVESFVVSVVEDYLSRLDPDGEPSTRMAVAKHMLGRGLEELGKGDAVQASEKLYKAVEECIKVLACLEGLEECRKAREEGRWWTSLLSRAARRLSERLRASFILEAWCQGYDLHVHGFHEHALDVEDVEKSVPTIKKLVEYAEERLRARKCGSAPPRPSL